MDDIKEKNNPLPSPPGDVQPSNPIVILLLGLAGAGKTSLTQRLANFILANKKRPYIVNLDPACADPPYPVNIDIRDTLDYRQVKEKYNLGPNGGIVTALNLFSAKFSEVIDILRLRGPTCDYILVDTPGQIEVFMWSASGQIIMECLGSLYPTVIAYVTDLKLSVNPITFISNMTYACAILYKSRLPVLLALNKADRVNPSFAKSWITDFEAFDSAVREMEGYSANLAASLSLGLDEMYAVLEHVGLSAASGEGVEEFMAAVNRVAAEYELVYRPHFEKLKAAQSTTHSRKRSQPPLELKHGSAFSTAGAVDAGAGLHVRLGLEEDDEDTSSDEEKMEEDDEEEMTFREVMQCEARKRAGKME